MDTPYIDTYHIITVILSIISNIIRTIRVFRVTRAIRAIRVDSVIRAGLLGLYRVVSTSSLSQW